MAICLFGASSASSGGGGILGHLFSSHGSSGCDSSSYTALARGAHCPLAVRWLGWCDCQLWNHELAYPHPLFQVWVQYGGFFTGGFEMYPSASIPFLLPGTTHTTVGGVLYLLDEDSSDEGDSSPLLASLGVRVSPS